MQNIDRAQALRSFARRRRNAMARANQTSDDQLREDYFIQATELEYFWADITNQDVGVAINELLEEIEAMQAEAEANA